MSVKAASASARIASRGTIKTSSPKTLLEAHPVAGNLSVRRLVLAKRKQRRVLVRRRRVFGERGVHFSDTLRGRRLYTAPGHFIICATTGAPPTPIPHPEVAAQAALEGCRPQRSGRRPSRLAPARTSGQQETFPRRISARGLRYQVTTTKGGEAPKGAPSIGRACISKRRRCRARQRALRSPLAFRRFAAALVAASERRNSAQAVLRAIDKQRGRYLRRQSRLSGTPRAPVIMPAGRMRPMNKL